MLEKLAEPAREDLRLGLLSPTVARQLTRLPAGNQAEVLQAARRESLTAAELRGVVDLLLLRERGEAPFVLEKPRQALQQTTGDRRELGPADEHGRQSRSQQLALLLDLLAAMETGCGTGAEGCWNCVIGGRCGRALSGWPETRRWRNWPTIFWGS